MLKSFPEFRDAWIDGAPAGALAFHGQLYPREYPSDLKARKELLARGRPLSALVSTKYLEMVQRTTARGVALGRLVMVHGPEEERYDPFHIHRTAEILQLVRAAGEQIRFAYYGRQIVALTQRCGEDSPLVRSYIEGADGPNPKASFWSLRTSGDAASLQAVWLMDYVDAEFAGGPVYQPPFTEHVRQYEAFWREVFENSEQSYELPMLHPD